MGCPPSCRRWKAAARQPQWAPGEDSNVQDPRVRVMLGPIQLSILRLDMWMWLLPGWGRRLAGTALLGRWAQNGNQCGVHHSSNTDRCLEGDGEQTGPLPHGLEEDPLSAPSRVSWREKRPESGRPASEGEGLGSGDRGNREKRLEREDSRDAEPISTGCGRREGRCPGSRLGRGGRRADPGAEGGGHRAVLGGGCGRCVGRRPHGAVAWT